MSTSAYTIRPEEAASLPERGDGGRRAELC